MNGRNVELALNQALNNMIILKQLLKQNANLLDALTSAGIQADGNSYILRSIKEAIEKGVGFTRFIKCNVDSSEQIPLPNRIGMISKLLQFSR
ncbi:hypothetical protein KIW84_041959 [Lathyrus oleraceus]|uniref:Uncharacterized protein n=1 Tax=Pisum sativum TaxID=3888 RepID=A0A9D5ASE5_PEA|nr:hypothetical protein KIW84_041959 [Pisum sativum]